MDQSEPLGGVVAKHEFLTFRLGAETAEALATLRASPEYWAKRGADPKKIAA